MVMIVITGLGRCGTSLMAMVFQELGFGMGKHGMSYGIRRRAGLEWAPAYAISRDMWDEYLRRGNPIDLYEEVNALYWGKISLRDRILRIDTDTPPERKEGTVELFKDPRMTWHPEIIKHWWEVRKDLRLIILHRKPENIIASRAQVAIDNWGSDAHFQDPKRGMDVKQFYDDYKGFVHMVKVLGIPHVIWNYPDFVKYPKNEMLDHLKGMEVAVNVTPEKFQAAWDTVFDKDKVHYREGEEE
jgi:hypothetical protein